MKFHKLVDTIGYKRAKEYLFKLMDKVIDEIGENHIVQIVMDNEASFKAAGKILMNMREHLYWTPCATHCIDLMLEDIEMVKRIRKPL